jgi:lactoylglutathione lyase
MVLLVDALAARSEADGDRAFDRLPPVRRRAFAEIDGLNGALRDAFDRPGDGARLELTYNPGVDSYDLGTGYNHIAVTAGDLDGSLSRLSQQGIEPEKPPYTVREGGNRLCFVRDPDGYRIELIEMDPATE